MPERLHNRCAGHRSDRLQWEGDDRPDWSAVFRQLHDQIQHEVRDQRPEAGPTAVALAVVVEALAIGEAMSGIGCSLESRTGNGSSTAAVYAQIDDQYLDQRAKALRTALHGVDDYIWWGSLSPAG